MDYKKYYLELLTKNKGKQLYHSFNSHYRSDVALKGNKENKSVQFSEEQRLKAQNHIARILNLRNPDFIHFSNSLFNVFENILDSLSNKILTIVTTDSEVYYPQAEFARYIKVPTLPYENFSKRFLDEINLNNPDIILLSHVFFNSGIVIHNLIEIFEKINDPNTLIIINGHHGFMAIPTDLSKLNANYIYVATLNESSINSNDFCFYYYHNNKYRFRNDLNFSNIERFNLTLDLFAKENITVEMIHFHIQELQYNFREYLLTIDHHYLTEKNILSVDYQNHGHFFSFALPSEEHAKKIHDELLANNVFTSYFENRLFFGFAIYQDECINLENLKK